MTKSTKNKSMLENAAILFIAMGITKVIGAVLKIPLANILGGLGMSYFSSAYSVFSPVFALTAAAIPIVMTKIVAQNVAAGNFKNVRKIKKVALRAAGLLGFAGTLLILIITVPFARFIADAPKSIPSMLLIAPSVFFCCVTAVYRGYFEGLRNTLPTALSQVIEAVVKATLGITLSYIVLIKTSSLPYAAAAAVLGITLSEGAGLLFIFLRSFGSDGITKEELDFSPPPESGMSLLKKFIREAFPITLGALAVNISSLIDLITITNCINLAVSRNKAYFLAEFTYGLQGGVTLSDLGNFIYGSYTGIVASLFTLIPAVTGMLSKSALPAVTAAWERCNDVHITRNLKILFKSTFVLGLPLCFGMAVLSEPVLNLLYSAKPAEAYVCAKPLFILSLGGITLSLTGTLFSIFQAIGRADLPVKLMLAGASVKLGLNLWLLQIPEINIAGAAIATVGCYGVICFFGFILLAKLIKIRIGILSFFGKALVNSAVCAFTAFAGYHYIFTGFGRIFQLGFSVIAGAGVYMILTVLTDRKLLKSYWFKVKRF
ncbi:MAG: polysaccharide biosynthesis protein [Oscillospiraceae bacterium]|nr:polysaccharide biosynthesis protein [Oscillospiraceae bacterium]